MLFSRGLIACLVLVIAGCAQNELVLQRQSLLEGRVEQLARGGVSTNERLSELTAVLKELQGKVQALNAALEALKPPPQETASQKPPADATPPSSPRVEVINSDPSSKDKDMTQSEAYMKAFGLYSANNYGGAVEAFQAFLTSYPESEYAGNAQYWIGECYYTQKEYAKALEAFKKVVEIYPKSAKVPDAMLKIGFSHISMNEPEKAVSALESLLEKYPKSPASAKAKERLKESRPGH